MAAGPDFYSISGNNTDQDAFELATKAGDEAAKGQKDHDASGTDHFWHWIALGLETPQLPATSSRA